MSRHNYDDDIEPRDLAMWRGRITSATRGQRGQRLFRDMLAALDAMPEKRLIADELLNADGECCLLGAVALHRGVPKDALLEIDFECDEGADDIAEKLDIAGCLAREVTYINDDWRSETPEQRWTRTRKWVESQIAKKGA